MQFTPISEPLLDASMWVLFACSAAAGLGGLMLLVACKWGVPLVTWQARVSMMTNGIVVFFIAIIAFGVVEGVVDLESTQSTFGLYRGELVAVDIP